MVPSESQVQSSHEGEAWEFQVSLERMSVVVGLALFCLETSGYVMDAAKQGCGV